MPKYTARQLVDLLASRHSGDVFVSECKNGPSCGGGLQVLDGWAMKRSWAHPLVVGYEVKVSRSDFLQDEKWRGYLPYCNEFYFVAPPKVIDPAEVAADAGLLVCSVNACRLFRRKKAPYREVQIPEEIFRYILFSRAVVGRPRWNPEEVSDRDFWTNWLAARNKDLDIGRRVGKGLRKAIAEQIDAVAKKNRLMASRMDEYENVRKLLKQLGINPDGYVSEYSVRNRIEQIQTLCPPRFLGTINRARDALGQLQEEITELTKAKAVDSETRHTGGKHD